MQYDVVIIGAGIAGLYTAMNLPRDKKVLIVNKAHPWECNTFYAQGGVTTAKDDADIPVHIKDTLEAGAGFCDEEAVEVLSRNSQQVITDLIKRGFSFDTMQMENSFILKKQHTLKNVFYMLVVMQLDVIYTTFYYKRIRIL